MQTAVAPMPLPGPPTVPAAMPAAADAATDSLVTVDFSALLLGQLVGQVAKEILPPTDTPATTDTATAEGLADPTQLLAAMGLILEPRAPQATPVLPQSGGTPLPAALPATGNTALAQAATPPTTADASPLPLAGDGKAPALTASGQTPANFAAFEQKLAESLETIAEPQAHPASLHAPQHAPARPAGDALQLATPVKDPAWPAEFSQKIVWMATQDKQNAQITLNPPQMGPIEISLSIKNEQASAVFVSGNAEVREVIEAALPRLREMLAGVGVELGQANVSAESFRQAQDQQTGERRTGGSGGELADGRGTVMDMGSSGTARGAVRTGNGLVDTFA